MNQKVYSVIEFTREDDWEIDADRVLGVFSSMEKAYDAVQSIRQIMENRGDGVTPDEYGRIVKFEDYDESSRVIPGTDLRITWITWELYGDFEISYMYKISEVILDEFSTDRRAEDDED